MRNGKLGNKGGEGRGVNSKNGENRLESLFRACHRAYILNLKSNNILIDKIGGGLSPPIPRGITVKIKNVTIVVHMKYDIRHTNFDMNGQYL